MNKTDKFHVGLIILLICIMVYLPIKRALDNKQYREYLEIQGYSVETNIRIESPSLIKDVDEQTFLNLAKSRTIYLPFVGAFYVFNEDMTIAYCYEIPWF